MPKLEHFSNRYELFYFCFYSIKRKAKKADRPTSLPARLGCRPGGGPKTPALGRPRLGSKAGAVAEATGLVLAQAEPRPGEQARHWPEPAGLVAGQAGAQAGLTERRRAAVAAGDRRWERKMGSGDTQKGRPAYPGNTREGWYG